MRHLDNCLDRKPFIVSVYDPIDRVIEKDYICLGNVPSNIISELKKSKPNIAIIKNYFKRDWSYLEQFFSSKKGKKGGEEEFIFTDEDLGIDTKIEEEETPQIDFKITEELPQEETTYQKGPNIEYRTFPQFFPDDNFIDVKEKITLLSGIPMYNQFLFWGYRGLENHTYNITVDGANWCFNHQQPKDATLDLYDLKVDKNIYMNRNSLGFLAQDNFMLINSSFPTVYRVFVVDANMYLNRIQKNAQEILNDTYLFELLYFGVIKKYFPIYQPDILRKALMGKTQDIQEIYPEIAPTIPDLTKKYKLEQEILSDIYDISGSKEDEGISKEISVSVNQAILGVINTFGNNSNVNLRNMFDVFEATSDFPYIGVTVSHMGGEYLLQKTYGSLDIENIDFYGFPKEFDNYLKIYTKEKMLFGIDETGDILIHKKWFEEDFVGFNDILEEAEKVINPLIKYLNQKKEYFIDGSLGEIVKIDKKSLIFDSVSSSIVWKRLISKEAFQFLRDQLNKWENAGMIKKKSLQVPDSISFRITKGINKYPYNQLNKVFSIADEYVYLTNPNAYQKLWNQFYGGKSATIYHRNISVKFESNNMENLEFQLFYYFCRALCVQVSEIKTQKYTKRKENQLKKLFEIDPDLYDLKKTASNKLYSVIVQKKYRPNILTAEEYEALSAEDKKRVYKYWNFTNQKPAFYICPNKKIPYLNFTPDIHPEGYCFPRCTTSRPQGSKNLLVYNTCMREHKIVTEKKDKIKHIVKYGKELAPGRFSFLPKRISQIIVDPNAVIVGVDYRPSSLINSLKTMFPETDILSEIILAVEKNPDIWADSLASLFFSSSEDFIMAIDKYIVKNLQSYLYPWDDIFVDMIGPVFGKKVIIFNDDLDEEINLLYPTGAINLLPENTIIMMKIENFHPIMIKEKNSISYQISQKSLDSIRYFYEQNYITEEIERIPRLNKFKASEIDKYVIFENMCIGLLLKNHVYLEIEEIEFSKEVKNKMVPDELKREKLASFDKLEKVLNSLTIDFSVLVKSGKIIGARYGNGLIALCKDTDKPRNLDLNESTILYEPYKINKKILTEGYEIYEDKSAAEAIYYNYLYQILKNTFLISYNQNEYGKKIRKKVLELTKKSLKSKSSVLEGFNNQISELMGPEDVDTIMEKYNRLVLNSITLSLFEDFLNKSFFNFDREKIRDLRKDANIKQKVKKALEKHVQITDSKRLNFKIDEIPNILYPCIGRTNLNKNKADLFCSGTKLKIPKDKFEAFVDILVSDIQNELTYQKMVLTISQNNIIDYFNFQKHPFERIFIEEI